MKIALALTAALSLTACAAGPAPYDGRALWSGEKTMPDKINQDVAQAMGLPLLPPAKLNLVPLLPHVAMVTSKEKEIYHRADMRMYHLYHEAVHVYQHTYGIKTYAESGCVKPLELEAMLLTWEWCESNYCPTHPEKRAYEIAGCSNE